jgi:hypothetical protein
MLSHARRDQRHSRCARNSRRGFSALYLSLGMLMLLGFISLAVDLGRVRTTKAQLMTAADAGALAAVASLPDQDFAAATNDARTIGQENNAIHNGVAEGPVVFDPDQDILFGLYRMDQTGLTADKRFTQVGQKEPSTGHLVVKSDCNAVKTIALRTAARGNNVRLFFAGIMGKPNIDVKADAIAMVYGGDQGGFGFVGLDWIKFGGNTSTDSWDGSKGGYNGGSAHDGGSIATNGTITLVGTTDIRGDARPGKDYAVNQTNNTTVTGWTAPLDYTLKYPVNNPPAGSYNLPGADDDATITPPNLYNGNKALVTKSQDGSIVFPSGGPNQMFGFKSWKGTSSTVKIVGQPGHMRMYTPAWPLNSSQVATDMGTEVYIIGPNGLSLNGDTITLDATKGPITFYISGDVGLNGHASINVAPSSKYPVRFFCNGNWDSQGGNLSNPQPNDPSLLYISMTGANTAIKISTQTSAHIYAPLSDVTFNGNANNPPADFYGWCIAKTLTTTGNAILHYDESLKTNQPYLQALVK